MDACPVVRPTVDKASNQELASAVWYKFLAMDIPPPPKPRSQRRTFIVTVLIVAAVFVLIAGGMFAVRFIIRSGITKGPDNLFGDQHLKNGSGSNRTT